MTFDFSKEYNREEFLEFLQNSFLPDDFIIDENDVIVEKQFHKIKKITKLGSVKSLGKNINQPLVIYEIKHKSEFDPRVTLTKEAFWMMKNDKAQRALAMFYSEKSRNYRLSLMTIDLEAKGKKVREEYSNPKRYSFFLGDNAKINTPYNYLIKKGKVSDFDNLLERFSVETVTNEFFEHYKELFEKLLDHLKDDRIFNKFAEKNNIDINSFAKKVLGQIVFLYFVQKRGWLGAEKGKGISTGDTNYLRNLFISRKERGKDYFNDSLEYLFYDALNKRSEKAGNFYRDYFKCQIPFLNGGLFEPLENYNWEKDFLHIPDDIFSNKKKDGILDIFDLYNFTIDENSDIEQEVSVDPEMLGKVFENLLDENLRKGKGTYYTPRKIVHYMCQESLVNYLINETEVPEEKIRNLVYKDIIFNIDDLKKTEKDESNGRKTVDKILTLWGKEVEELDNELRNIKIVDPACGSGAFLIGMLQEIVNARQILQRFSDNSISEYNLKKETIQNCIYGVDIDSGAVEIAKLRLWLSLVVDHNLEEIEPLPNLDYKIMQGNSLLDELILGNISINLFNSQAIKKKRGKTKKEDKRIQDRLSLGGNTIIEDTDEILLNDYYKIQINYFNETDPELKKRLKHSLEKIEYELIEKSVTKELNKLEEENKSIGKYLVPNLSLTDEDFEKVKKNVSKQDQITKLLLDLKKSKIKPFFLWRLYFADVFDTKGGFDIVVANPPYIAYYGRHAKKIDDYQMRYFIKNFNTFSDISERKNVSINTVMLFLEKGLNILSKGGSLTYIIDQAFLNIDVYRRSRKYILDNYKIKELVTDVKFPQVIAETCILQTINQKPEKQYNFNFKKKMINAPINHMNSVDVVNNDYEFSLSENENLTNRIINNTEMLKKVANTYTGMQIIPEYFLSDDDKVINSPKWHKNAFSKNVLKYKIIWPTTKQAGKYITYDNDLQDKVRDILRTRLENGEKCRKPETLSIGSREKEIRFKTPKIIISQTVSNADNKVQLQAALDDEVGYYGNVSIHLVRHDNLDYLKYLLAILNSSMVSFYCVERKLILGSEKGSKKTPQIRKGGIDRIPIKVVGETEQKPLIDLVDNILYITKSSDYLNSVEKQGEVEKIQDNINQSVYKLYGLNQEDIKIIENSFK
jgi:adenine-specific DNA-methyltransferase